MPPDDMAMVGLSDTRLLQSVTGSFQSVTGSSHAASGFGAFDSGASMRFPSASSVAFTTDC